MSANPAFASTLAVGAGLVPATLDTSLTAPTNTTSVVSGGSSGTKIEEVVYSGVGTTVAGLVNVFLYDGSTYHLYDQVPITAITVSATVQAFRLPRQYPNLFIKSGWSLRVANTISGNQSMVKVVATGGDY